LFLFTITGILKNAIPPKEIPADFFDTGKVKQEPGVKVKTESGLLPVAQYGSDDEEMEVDQKPSK
jgi:hypothetical protein